MTLIMMTCCGRFWFSDDPHHDDVLRQILVLDEEAHAKRDELARMAAALEEALRRPTPHAAAALAVKGLRSAVHPVAAEALYRGRPEPESVR